MPETTKSSAAKTARRMTKPETCEMPAASRAAVAVAQPMSSEKQLGSFEAAMKLFHARDLMQARELFLQAAKGPERDVVKGRIKALEDRKDELKHQFNKARFDALVDDVQGEWHNFRS